MRMPQNSVTVLHRVSHVEVGQNHLKNCLPVITHSLAYRLEYGVNHISTNNFVQSYMTVVIPGDLSI